MGPSAAPQKTRLIDDLRAVRVIPIIRTQLKQDASTAIQWLRDAGFRTFEITLTVPDALALIRDLSSDRSLLVGAGTVPDAAAARACIAAGAKFVVAPWVDPDLAAPCRDGDVLLMLGAMSPSEVRLAIAAGADVVKIFPAASAGGPAHIKALRSVFPRTPFCPTGGIEPKNWIDYVAAGADFVGMGGAMVDIRQIKAGNRDAILSVAEKVLAAAKEDRLQA